MLSMKPASRRGDFDAARGNADERHGGEIGIALDDLVCDAPQGALDRGCVEDESRCGRRVGSVMLSFATSRDRVKGER